MIRSHPGFSDALVVDAIIYNRASSSQPFLPLELRFVDLNSHLIVNRRFELGEHLGGELTGWTGMPPQIPIHVSLDALDPGLRAVNYSLSFHSSERPERPRRLSSGRHTHLLARSARRKRRSSSNRGS